jgi:hypothetical protein
LKPQEREVEVRVGFADTLWGEWRLHSAQNLAGEAFTSV